MNHNCDKLALYAISFPFYHVSFAFSSDFLRKQLSLSTATCRRNPPRRALGLDGAPLGKRADAKRGHHSTAVDRHLDLSFGRHDCWIRSLLHRFCPKDLVSEYRDTKHSSVLCPSAHPFPIALFSPETHGFSGKKKRVRSASPCCRIHPCFSGRLSKVCRRKCHHGRHPHTV